MVQLLFAHVTMQKALLGQVFSQMPITRQGKRKTKNVIDILFEVDLHRIRSNSANCIDRTENGNQ